MARILVLGRGVFGSLAARELQARGHEATNATRRDGVDARDEESVARAAASHEGILHAAGPFLSAEPGAARAAAKLGIPYADLSDDAAFSERVRAVGSASPLLTGMSTTPALAEALVAIARRRAPDASPIVAMHVGGANEQGPATMAFAARSRAEGPSIVVDFPGIGRRRAFPARAAVEAEYFVAVGGVAGLGWRFRPLLRIAAPLAHRVPRLGRDTAGALVASAGKARESLHAREGGQRMAVLPAVFALEEALAGRAPRRAALPREWIDAERLVGFLCEAGFTRTSA